MGALLTQKINDREHPIAYASKTLTKTERNYCVTEREALAIVWAATYLGPWKNICPADRKKTIKFIRTVRDPKHRLARWIA